MQKRLLITAITLAALAATWAIVPRLDTATEQDACSRWVDSVYNSLSERERVAQLVFPKVVPTKGADSRAVIKRYVEKNGVGGLLFTAGSLEDYIEMTNYAKSIAKVPLIMTFDGEWGLAMRISGTAKFPCNMALGAVNDLSLIYEYGKEMGRHCRLTGIDVDYAPVVDVNSNPRNPVIGRRSFGEDPHRVSAAAIAFSQGMESMGVQSVTKHFPGHGDTSTDSHKERTLVHHDRPTLDSVDLLPFQEYIDAGLSGVMVGHIVVEALDPSMRPASLSHKMVTGLLREEMGFNGLIYTDALSMKGARLEGYNSAVEALKAGCDVLETSDDPIGDIDAIYALVQSGKISREVIEEHCKRVLRYKYILGVHK